MRLIKKRIRLKLLKLIYRKSKKKAINWKDSIRPTGVTTVLPKNWVEPQKRENSDGTVSLYGFENLK